MKCLVLGGAGFLGSHLVYGLLANGHRVTVFDRVDANNHNLERVIQDIEFVSGDFQDEGCISEVLDNVDIVYHFISTTIPKTSNENPIYDIESNLAASVKWIAAAQKVGVKKIVFVSSGGTIYGKYATIPILETHPTDPLCSHGIIKLAIEKYLYLYHHLSGLEFTVLRISNLYGERQDLLGGLGAITAFLWKALNGQPITIWGDGTISRDYIYVSDAVKALLIVGENYSKSKIYNIGSGKSYTLLEIIELIHNITGIAPKVVFEEGRKFDVPINCLDISLARRELNWSPKVEIEEGIKRTFFWLKSMIERPAG